LPTPLLWSLPLREPLYGLSLAQEAVRLLLNGAGGLRLLNHRGEVRAQYRPNSPVQFAELSQDARLIVTVDEAGTIQAFDSDLEPIWKQSARERVCSLTVEPLGHFVAVAENKSSVSIFTAKGEKFHRFTTPRPVVKMSFLSLSGHLLCVGDLGWLAAYDLARKDWAWRGTLFFNVAYVGVAAGEEPILVGGFSDAIAAFNSDGKRFEWPFVLPPAREVSLNYDGRKLFCLTREGLLRSYSIQGHELADFPARTGVSHFVSDGIGQRLYLATTSGHLEAIQSLSISSRRG
jgi:WD40 repeat protein